MDNSKNKFILTGILIVTLILGSYIVISFILTNLNNENIKQQNSFQILTSNNNNVEFQVTPLSPSEFQITINTHSVELDFDLTQISILYDDLGNLYKPLKWEGSAPSGHHREGVLKFQDINKNVKSIKLVIIDNVERQFSWRLK